jgi:hypothetical protein
MHPFEKNIHDADEFWSGAGKVHNTLRHVGAILDCEGIAYAVMGRAAQMAHGFEQYNLNTDVIVVTSDGLKAMHRRLPARGFIKLSERRFRDTTTDLEFRVVVTGELAAGDSSPIRFPDPAQASIKRGGYRVVDLAHFVELKLASGLRETHLRDRADVLQLIQEAKLSPDLANEIHPCVRDEYDRLWLLAQKHDPMFD